MSAPLNRDVDRAIAQDPRLARQGQDGGGFFFRNQGRALQSCPMRKAGAVINPRLVQVAQGRIKKLALA
jgi:hypothetical protein